MARNDRSWKTVWFYDVDKEHGKESRLGRARYFLYEKLRRSVTQHNVLECYKLIRLLPKDTTLDDYVLFRFLMILIETVDESRVNKNFIIYLESILSKLDLYKPDTFVEYLSYFMKHNRLDDARELFSQRQRFMTYRIHRPVPFVDINLRCYELLLNYQDWESQVERGDRKFDISIQGWLVNAIDRLKNVTGNYEYFVMCITRVLLFYGFNKKAYLFVSEFQRNNPANISAQLLLYYLIERLSPIKIKVCNQERDEQTSMICDTNEEVCSKNRADELEKINNFSLDEEHVNLEAFPVDSDEKDILRNLRDLDIGREEILSLNLCHNSKIQVVRDLMDSLEYLECIGDAIRWETLRNYLHEIIESKDDELISGLKTLWQTRYQGYWRTKAFKSLVRDNRSLKKLVKKVITTLSSNLDLQYPEHDETFDESDDLTMVAEDEEESFR